MMVRQPARPPDPAGRLEAAAARAVQRPPEARRRGGAAATALAALLRAGLTPEQMSRLADLRVRVRRGGYAADGAGGPSEAIAGSGA